MVDRPVGEEPLRPGPAVSCDEPAESAERLAGPRRARRAASVSCWRDLACSATCGDQRCIALPGELSSGACGCASPTVPGGVSLSATRVSTSCNVVTNATTIATANATAKIATAVRWLRSLFMRTSNAQQELTQSFPVGSRLLLGAGQIDQRAKPPEPTWSFIGSAAFEAPDLKHPTKADSARISHSGSD
jgi:hypothetical protein